MLQFLSVNFFSWISSIFVGFFKIPVFLYHPVLYLTLRHTQIIPQCLMLQTPCIFILINYYTNKCS